MDKVTIIMPVYNSENTISSTIDSVLSQTYKDIEFIIVNDGSKDNSDSICRKYASENKCIKYYKKENTGVSSTRNYALKNAKGKYITFIDSDDCYTKDYIEKMVDTIKKQNTEMVICGYKRINYLTGKEVSKYIDKKNYNKKEYNKLIEKAQKNNIFNQIWNKLFIKKIIDLNEIRFDENISLGEDFRFVVNYIKNINSVSTINNELYLYTNSIDGLNCKYRKDRFEINLSNMQLLEDLFIKNKFNLKYINEKYIITILSGIKNICLNPKQNEISDELKKLKENQVVQDKLQEKTSFKYNIIAKIIYFSNIRVLKFFGKILIIYDKYYNKKKLGY